MAMGKLFSSLLPCCVKVGIILNDLHSQSYNINMVKLILHWDSRMKLSVFCVVNFSNARLSSMHICTKNISLTLVLLATVMTLVC